MSVRAAHRDAALLSLSGAIKAYFLCEDVPPTYAAAASTRLASVDVLSGDFNIASTTYDGRELTYLGGVAIGEEDGTAAYIVGVNPAEGRIESVHDIDEPVAVFAATSVTINAFSVWEIA